MLATVSVGTTLRELSGRGKQVPRIVALTLPGPVGAAVSAAANSWWDTPDSSRLGHAPSS